MPLIWVASNVQYIVHNYQKPVSLKKFLKFNVKIFRFPSFWVLILDPYHHVPVYFHPSQQPVSFGVKSLHGSKKSLKYRQKHTYNRSTKHQLLGTWSNDTFNIHIYTLQGNANINWHKNSLHVNILNCIYCALKWTTRKCWNQHSVTPFLSLHVSRINKYGTDTYRSIQDFLYETPRAQIFCTEDIEPTMKFLHYVL